VCTHLDDSFDYVFSQVKDEKLRIFFKKMDDWLSKIIQNDFLIKIKISFHINASANWKQSNGV
jgi:hypothetical protein